MPPKKRNQEIITENIPSILIKDLKVYVEPIYKNNIECNNELSVFRVQYRFLLDAKCDDGKKMIDVKSNKQLWELNEDRENKDYAMIMKKQSIDALATHAGKQVRCHFDYRLEQGELPRLDMIWKFSG
jgi:ATP-dependent exoDNAse (exonuclease V) alpha subunit